MLALFFVVAFGSSLDVAAIQADSPDPLDYNSELRTVGAISALFRFMEHAPGATFTALKTGACDSRVFMHEQILGIKKVCACVKMPHACLT